MNLYPFKISCLIRIYSNETEFTTESVSRLVMAYDSNEAKEKFKQHYTLCVGKYKVKFYNLEIEEPII